MTRSGKYVAVAFATLMVLLSVSERAMADGSVTVEVGHSWTKSFSKTPFESKPKISVDKANIASATWSGGESGTLVITGLEEGEAVVTVKGKVRVVGLGTDGGITVRDVSGKIRVKVTAKGEYARIVVLKVDQKISIKFPKGMRLGPKAPDNTDPSVVSVRRNSSKQLTLRGRKKGQSWLTFKLFIKQKKGKDKKVPGTIWVIVRDGKPPKDEKYIKIGWDDLPTGIITLDGQVSLWVPTGDNYGNIGNACFVNYDGDEETCGVEDGSWVKSNDGQYQDFVVTDVPTYGEDPPSGYSSLDKEFPLPSETVVVIKDTPGVCASFHTPPPPAGEMDAFTIKPPDEESEALTSVVDEISQIDFTKKPLTGMSPEQAKATACQAAVWKVGSQIDSVEGNDVTNEDLKDRFFNTYLSATTAIREKMTPEKRDEMDNIVQDDLTTVIESVDFVSKKHGGKPVASDTVSVVQPGPPSGLEWLASKPPAGVGNVVVRNGDLAVGVVLPADIRQGDQVSGTMVVLPVGSEPPNGLSLRDPSGQIHPVETGRSVTFTANQPVMTWAIIDKDETVLGSAEALTSQPQLAPSRNGPTIVQSDCPFDLPGTFDGDSSNTVVSIGGHPAKILSESPRQAVVVPEDLGTIAGKVPIEVTDAGTTFTHDARVINTSFEYPEIAPGQWGDAKLTVSGLDDPEVQDSLGLMVTNCTPEIVKFRDGGNRKHFIVNPDDIHEDGTYSLAVPVQSLQDGTYVLAASSGLAQQSQCPIMSCAPCGDIWVCDDRGKVNCGGARTCTCGGGAGHRMFGGPCGFWFCGCPFGRCQC